MIYQNGGDPSNPDSLVEEVLQYYLKFKNGIEVWDETLPSSTVAFAQEKLAFYFGPSWRMFNFNEANPNLNFGVTTVPQLPSLPGTEWEDAEQGSAELTDIGWLSFWVEGVSGGSKYQEEAWQFLEFLASKEGMQKLYTAQSQIRQFGEIYPRKDLSQNLTEPYLKPFVDQADTGETWYLASSTHDGSGINSRVIKYYGDALNSLDQGETNVVETLSSGIQQVLSQYGVEQP
jgi:ABC-type glycerol-3-phosphate transport system substrate-binding protein